MIRNRILSIGLILTLTSFSMGQVDAPSVLVLDGDVKIVDKERIVKDKVQQVNSFPLKIKPPKVDNADYTWDVPDGVKTNGRLDEVLEITDAPKGELKATVRVTSFTDGKRVSNRWSITFYIGEITPPKPPDPPFPTDELSKAVLYAYNTDLDPLKAQHLEKVGSVWKTASNTAKSDPSTTVAQLFIKYRQMSLGLGLKDQDLNGVRTKIQEYLDVKLPTRTETQLTPEIRNLCETEFTKVHKSLEALKKK